LTFSLRQPAPLALLTVLLLYNVATLGRVPAYWNDDDGFYASAAWQFWRTGKPGVPGYQDIVGLERDVWANGRTAAAVQGVFTRLAGVSFFAAVLPSFLAGIGLLAATHALGRSLWDASTAGLAVLLLAASGKFFDACRWARPDILLAVCFVAALWLVASAPPEKPARRLFLSGLLMGISGDVHLNGFVLAPVPLLFWLLLRRARSGRGRAAAAYCAAVAAGALLWLALHYWPDPAAFREQFAVYGGPTHSQRLLERSWSAALQAEAGRYTDWFWAARGHRHLLEGLCTLAAGAWLLWRESTTGVALVGGWLAFFVLAAAFMSNPFGWYLILVWPLFALWMARFFLALPWPRLTRLAMLALFSAYAVNLGLWGWKAFPDTPLRSRSAELRTAIPADAPVVANGAFWFAFWDRDFTDESYVRFRRHQAQVNGGSDPASWATEQKKRGWRYIVASGNLRRFLDPAEPLEPLISSDFHSDDAAHIRETRAFSLARCSVERRLEGLADSILILRVHE